MTENQKLREAIKRLLKAHRITVQAPPKTITDAENQIAEIQNAVKFAEEALALPTAEVMTNGLTQAETDASASVSGLTAAPVGERDRFEKWATNDGAWSNNIVRSSCNPGNYANHAIQQLWLAWQARAALSAGDAVDAQRWRYAMDWGTKDFAVCMRVGATGVCWEPIKTDGPIDAAIAARAKGGE